MPEITLTPDAAFVESIHTENTGGNVMNDVITLTTGMVLVVTDEVVCAYSDRDYQLGLEPVWCKEL